MKPPEASNESINIIARPSLDRVKQSMGRLGLALLLAISGTVVNEGYEAWQGHEDIAEAQTPEDGPYNFNNSDIASKAKAELGQTFATGWNQPGECMVAAKRWAVAANGGMDFFRSGGVISVWTNAGGVETSLDHLKSGDILQKASQGSDFDSNWNHVHTAVFEGYNADGTARTIDSNQQWDGTVREHATYSLASTTYGDGSIWKWHAYRFGKVESTAALSNPSSLGLHAPAALNDSATGKNVFFVDSDQTLVQYGTSGNSWVRFPLGAKAAANTTPSAVLDQGTGRNVFYVSTDGHIHQESVGGNSWADFNLGGEPVAANTSPSAVEDPNLGRNIFYVGEDHAIWQWSVSQGRWVNFRLGGNVAPNTSPTAIYDLTYGRQIFYVDSNTSGIDQFSVSNGAWVNFDMGGVAAPNTSPSALVDPDTGRNIFFAGTDGAVYQWSVSNNTWTQFRLGGSVAADTSPTAIEDPNTGRNIFFVGGDGTAYQWSTGTINGTSWIQYPLGPSSEAAYSGSNFGGFADSSNGRQLFYEGADGAIYQWSVSGSSWQNYRIG